MLNEVFFLAKYYFEYNVPINQVMVLLLNLIPFLLSFSIPFAVLPGYLLTMGRFSMDSEVIALKSCGISALRIIRPGLVIGVIIGIFAFFFKDRVEMPANMNYLQLKAKIMSQKPAVELMENQFLELGGFKLNFSRMEQEGDWQVLYDIHLIDISGRRTIEAEKGRIFSDPEDPEHYILKFMNGSISEVNTSIGDDGKKEQHFFVASFKYLAINRFVQLPQEFYNKSPDTMSIDELKEDIAERSKGIWESIAQQEVIKKNHQKTIDDAWKNYEKDIKNETNKTVIESKKKQVELLEQGIKQNIIQVDKVIDSYMKGLPSFQMMKFQEKYAMPVTSFVFAFICLSFGLFKVRSGRNEGLEISLLIMIFFYGFKVFIDDLVTKQTLSSLGVWIPNLIFLSIGIYMFSRKIRE
jgi:lipopolysaccharide export system permease protein